MTPAALTRMLLGVSALCAVVCCGQTALSARHHTHSREATTTVPARDAVQAGQQPRCETRPLIEHSTAVALQTIELPAVRATTSAATLTGFKAASQSSTARYQ